MSAPPALKDRFRGYLPVVVDVETSGFDAHTHAPLEIAAVAVSMDENGLLHPGEKANVHLEPFEGAVIDPKAIEFNGIQLDHPFRKAMTLSEADGLQKIFEMVRGQVRANKCQRAILVGHNAFFDLGFINAAVERQKTKRNPFHAFSSFDTSTLAGLALGHTVLARACALANIPFDTKEAHSALYDAERTAELFCHIVNRWQALGGWPLANNPTS